MNCSPYVLRCTPPPLNVKFKKHWWGVRYFPLRIYIFIYDNQRGASLYTRAYSLQRITVPHVRVILRPCVPTQWQSIKQSQIQRYIREMWLLILNLASKFWWLTVWAWSVKDTNNPIILTTEGLTHIAYFVSFGSYQTTQISVVILLLKL